MGILNALVSVALNPAIRKETKVFVAKTVAKIQEQKPIQGPVQQPSLGQTVRQVQSTYTPPQQNPMSSFQSPYADPKIRQGVIDTGKAIVQDFTAPFTKDKVQQDVSEVKSTLNRGATALNEYLTRNHEEARKKGLVKTEIDMAKGAYKNVVNTLDEIGTGVDNIFSWGLQKLGADTTKRVQENVAARKIQEQRLAPQNAAESLGGFTSNLAIWTGLALLSEGAISKNWFGVAKNALPSSAQTMAVSSASDLLPFGLVNAVQESADADFDTKQWLKNTVGQAILGATFEKAFFRTAPKLIKETLGESKVKALYSKLKTSVDNLKKQGFAPEEIEAKIQELGSAPQIRELFGQKVLPAKEGENFVTRRPQEAFLGGREEITPEQLTLRQGVEDVVRNQNAKIPDEEIVRIREENLLNPETLDEIILRKRGIITDAEAIERAKALKAKVEDILNLPKGSTATKEQITAFDQTIASERELNKKLRQSVAEAANDPTVDIANLNEALAKHTFRLKKLEIVRLGLGSEAGRSLQGLKQRVEGIDARMRAVYQRLKKKTTLEQEAVLKQIADAPIEDNKNFVKLLDRLNDADFFEKAAEAITAAKLWNPGTHIVNTVSNATRQLVDVVAQVGVNPHLIPADIAGSVIGLGKGLKSAFKALTNEGYAQNLSKFMETGGATPAIKGKLGRIVRIPFTALSAEDEIFKGIAFERSMYRQAFQKAKGNLKKMKELLEKPPLEMMEKASKEATHLTFQDEMGGFLKKIDTLRRPEMANTKIEKSGALITRAFVTFLRTPGNLFKQALGDFTPIGVVKNIKWKEGFSEANRKALAEVAIGTGLMAWAWQKTQDGEMTGGTPQNESDRDQFYREGKLPYAIKIGDKWYQYKRLDPFATTLGLMADVVTNRDNQDQKKFSYYIGLISEQLKDKTFLEGVSNLLDLFVGEEWERDRAFNNLITSSLSPVPSVVGATARAIDPVVRNPEGILENFLTQIPFYSKDVPGRVNAIGNSIERANKGLNGFFNPFLSSDESTIDPVTELLAESTTRLVLPSEKFTIEGQEIKLNNEQYEQYSQRVGYAINDILLRIAADPKKKELFLKAPLEERQKVIDKIREKVTDTAKKVFAIQNNLLDLDKLRESLGIEEEISEELQP